MSSGAEVVSAERVIRAPAEAIFALVSDPVRHRDIDGSGAVRGAKGTAEPLKLGSKFGMSMRMGVPYSMVNTVIEFEPNRRIAWRTTGPTAIGRRFGGRVWRYELESCDEGTRVRESWDYSGESAITKPMVKRAGDATRRNMEATLERIATLVEPS